MTAALVDGHKWGVEVSDRTTATDGSTVFYNLKVVTDRAAPEGYAQAAAAAKAMSTSGKHVVAIRYEGPTKLALADYVKRVAPAPQEGGEAAQPPRIPGRNIDL